MRRIAGITRSSLRTPAFTMIEMIVVLVILAIMAAMVVPRMTGNAQREFRYAVDEVADMLTMFAQRQNLGQKPVGIFQDRGQNSLALMVMDTDAGASEQGAGWRMDRYVQPIQFPPFMLDTDIDIMIDGQRVDASQWPITCEIGQERPTIQIAMRGAGEWATLTLHPYGVAPEVTNDRETLSAARMPLDLDGSGRSREDW